MAFSSNAAEEAVRQLHATAKTMRAVASSFIAQCDIGSLNLADVMNWMRDLGKIYKPQWAILATVPGVGVWLETKYGVVNGDDAIATAQTNMQSMVDFLEANIPVDASNRPLTIVMAKDGNGTITGRLYTNAPALATFKAKLETFRNTFNP
jgi:hypothetical protein